MAYYRELILQDIGQIEPDLLSLRFGMGGSATAITVRTSDLQRPLQPGESLLVIFGPSGTAQQLIIGQDHWHRPDCPADCRRFSAWAVES